MTETPDDTSKVQPVAKAELVPLVQVTAPLPEPLEGLFTLSAWADSLVNRVPYKEPDPEYLSRMLLIQTLSAETPEQVMEQAGIRSLQKAVPDVPGGCTGPIEVFELYVTGSDFGEGAPCYIIFTATDMETGAVSRYSTGAQQVQAQFLRLIGFGVWPIRCNIKRTDRKDRGGHFLFWVFPPD